MAPTPAGVRARALRGSIFAGLIAGALALPSLSAAQVSCTPTAGEAILKISPAALPPPENGKYGFKLKTTIDGCVADAARLSSWVPSKNGTADGALIAQAELQLAVAGYGNCGFGLLSANAAAYPATGTLKLKWLDAAGDTIKSAKPTSAYVRISGIIPNPGRFVATGNGVVTKGLGVGGNVNLTMPIKMDLNDPFSDPWGLCLIGSGGPIPPFPGLPPAVPLKQLTLTARPSVAIGFPSFP